MDKRCDVVVVGGGLAGLTAAAAAGAAGASAIVLERAVAQGGRAVVAQKGVYTFNLGAHALYVSGEGMRHLRQLRINVAGAAPPLRRYQVLKDGALHTMPSNPLTLLRTTALGWRSKVALGRLLAKLPKLRAPDFAEQSTHDWLVNAGLTDEAVAVAAAIVRLSTYAGDMNTLSADAAIAQLQRAADGGVLYLDGGWRQLVEALAAITGPPMHAKAAAVTADTSGVEVHTAEGDRITAAAAVVATGTPAAAARLLRNSRWATVGPPMTAACLDLGVRRLPSPGYVLAVDQPLYSAVQSPPAHQSPAGHAVVAVIRYGSRTGDQDRADLVEHRRVAGIADNDVDVERFLPRMVVAGAAPRPDSGGLGGRPTVHDTGASNVLIAGDWVGPAGLLADAAIASGYTAGVKAAEISMHAPTST